MNKTVNEWTDALINEAEKALVGQTQLLKLIICALFSQGHVLLEGVPGLGKTLAARILAAILEGSFARIQFTPDLMPSDITGSSIFNFETRSFTVHKGPLFNNIILADEINRTPPKTQAALLEAMEEGSVTIDGVTMTLPLPFMVLATQNPVEFEGTYPLPEAQLDRFMMKLKIDYSSPESELEVVRRILNGSGTVSLAERVRQIITAVDLSAIEGEVRQVHLQDKVLDYIGILVRETRKHRFLLMGASPRATIALAKGARAWAAMSGRGYVLPEDVQDLFLPVLRHRVILLPDAEMEGITPDRALNDILSKTEIPR